MPHKHTRRKGVDEFNFNLAPSTKAKPLAAYEKDKVQKGKNGKIQAKKPKDAPHGSTKVKILSDSGYKHDDTPRAFARMMDLQASNKRQRSGLDDGDERVSRKKHKKSQGDIATAQPKEQSKAEVAGMPKILPGERLGDFNARVNHALPVSGLARKGKVEGAKERQTKTEKRMHKMYASWREDDAKRKEQLEEAQELAEEAEEEKEAALGGQSVSFPASTTGAKKGKRTRMIGEQADDDEDPWAELKLKREAPKGLHDVAQAPPQLKHVREKFKLKGGAKVDVMNVPNKAGSLMKREGLSEARKEVIERYRSMMKKGGG